jgi:isopentenyl-diphosphate delta-isomerase type 1
MSEEWFDVVDEADRVVGAAPRSDVHARGLRHRAVHVLVFDAAGRVVLQRRSLAKDLYPGPWDSSASGHLGRGEDYDAAAARELAEELGVAPVPALAPVARIAACAGTGWEFVRTYRCRHDGPLQPDPGEVSEVRWLPPAEVDAWLKRCPRDFAPSFLLVWNAWREAGSPL